MKRVDWQARRVSGAEFWQANGDEISYDELMSEQMRFRAHRVMFLIALLVVGGIALAVWAVRP